MTYKLHRNRANIVALSVTSDLKVYEMVQVGSKFSRYDERKLTVTKFISHRRVRHEAEYGELTNALSDQEWPVKRGAALRGLNNHGEGGSVRELRTAPNLWIAWASTIPQYVIEWYPTRRKHSV